MQGKRHKISVTLVLLAAAVLLSALPVSAEVLYKTFSNGHLTVHYEVVLPEPFDADRAYPAVLGFGGGSQSMDTVDGAIERYFRDQAQRRGYIVVVPAAPEGQLFFEDGDRIFPAFLQQLLSQYKIEDNKFHIAGPSNGGISAFHVAAQYPDYFLSITAFPGYLPDDTPEHIRAIEGMCINMFVGELDPLGWQPLMQAQAREFRSRGLAAQLSIEQGQRHRPETLEGAKAARLFDLFEHAQHGCAGTAARGTAH